ncbi:MAG: CDP-diacylglycerol--glycerol-3-phosphate 3-phosphatidyltransferase [Ignavibacteriaceae bacterium]|nr:CDP-diacylglycerol--glycerol-3-phosphate 3-phosphatidyltransferase [Ignavibacteriaceae bacterium]
MVRELFQISNLLSLLRIFLVIPFWLMMEASVYDQNRIILIGLCLFAGVTDILDGYLARKLNQITELGKILDPLADKICVAAIFLKLYLLGEIPLFLTAVVVGRDVLIVIAALLVSKRIKKVLPSNMLGKITVLVICFYILIVLYGVPKDHMLNMSFLYASVSMIFISLIGYGIRAKEFVEKD